MNPLIELARSLTDGGGSAWLAVPVLLGAWTILMSLAIHRVTWVAEKV